MKLLFSAARWQFSSCPVPTTWLCFPSCRILVARGIHGKISAPTLHYTNPRTNERTNERTHTHTRTHTAPRAVGCSWVFSAMLKSLTSVVLRLKENTGHLLPPPNPCWCRDTNLQPLDSKSNSRTIRPRLPNVSPSQNSCNCPITCCARSEETDLPFITFIRLRISIGKHFPSEKSLALTVFIVVFVIGPLLVSQVSWWTWSFLSYSL